MAGQEDKTEPVGDGCLRHPVSHLDSHSNIE
jgi:hypothetical protein